MTPSKLNAKAKKIERELGPHVNGVIQENFEKRGWGADKTTSALLGVKVSTINGWLWGTIPPIPELMALSKLFGIPMVDFLPKKFRGRVDSRNEKKRHHY